MSKSIYTMGAIASGGLLAVMIYFNGELASYTSPFWSSLIAHFVGIFASWFLWRTMIRSNNLIPFSPEAPVWSYFGGVCGALIVAIANITVNSSIGLVGSLSLMILGQTLFAMLFDFMGWFGMENRRLNINDLGRVLFILAGSILIINY